MALKINFILFVTCALTIFTSTSGLLDQNANHISNNASINAIRKPTIPVESYESVEEDTTPPVPVIIFFIFFTIFIIAMCIVIPLRCYKKGYCNDSCCCNDQCFTEICCFNICAVTFEEERSHFASTERLIRRNSTRRPVRVGSLTSTPSASITIQQQIRQLDSLQINFPPTSTATGHGRTPPPSYSAAVNDEWNYPPLPKQQSSRANSSKQNPITELSTVSSESFATGYPG